MNKHFFIDKKIFSKEAVLATAYWCADRFVTIINDKGDEFSIELTPIADYVIKDNDIESFNLMLVHNQIRHQLSEKFADLESAIITKAFAPIHDKRD